MGKGLRQEHSEVLGPQFWIPIVQLYLHLQPPEITTLEVQDNWKLYSQEEIKIELVNKQM